MNKARFLLMSCASFLDLLRSWLPYPGRAPLLLCSSQSIVSTHVTSAGDLAH